MPLPVLHVAGSPFVQGCQHGEALQAAIGQNLERYFERFTLEGLSRPAVLEYAESQLAALAQRSPSYHDGVRGIAAGSGFALAEIAALNARYEILYYSYGQAGSVRARIADGCTALAVPANRSRTGQVLLAQNWDWFPDTAGALIHTDGPDTVETLAFTEAGIFGGKIGMNAAGLGLVINGLTAVDDDWARPAAPFHLRCYEILRCTTLEAAIAVVQQTPRACSANFLLAQAPDRAINLEAAPERVGRTDGGSECLIHANHFVDPLALGVTEAPDPRRVYSGRRADRLRAVCARPQRLDVSALQSALRDHEGFPHSVCGHVDSDDPPDERFATVVSVILDLGARRLHLAAGPPCRGTYVEYSLTGEMVSAG